MTTSFNQAPPAFAYSKQMRLWVVPFDLEAGVLVDHPLAVDSDRMGTAA